MLPSLLFVIAGGAFAIYSLFTRPSAAPVIDLPNGTSFTVGWLSVGALICFLYAILYFTGVRLLQLEVPIYLALAHLLITVLAVLGLNNQHYLGLGYLPFGVAPAPNSSLTFLTRHAYTLLAIGSFLFVATMLYAWLAKLIRPTG